MYNFIISDTENNVQFNISKNKRFKGKCYRFGEVCLKIRLFSSFFN